MVARPLHLTGNKERQFERLAGGLQMSKISASPVDEHAVPSPLLHLRRSARPIAMLRLQRTLGNASVARLLERCACEERDAVQRDISTPLPDEAVKRKNGTALLTLANVQITFKPDRKSKNKKMKGARTTFAFRAGQPTPKFEKGALVSVTQPKVTITVQTTYGPKADPESQSAYGKGTTDEDKEAGTASLRYHEGSHGLDYIQFVTDNPPVINAEVGMTKAEYNEALADYKKMIKTYSKQMDEFSEQRTDCVGTTIDEAGFTKKPICP